MPALLSYRQVQSLIGKNPAGLLHFLVITSALHSGYARAQTDHLTELDWVPRDQLTEEQAINCPKACSGAYIEPVRNDEYADMAPRNAPILGEADEGEIRTDTSTAKLEGNVRFTQGNRELQAESVQIDRERGYVNLRGNVLIREPGILMLGESAEIEAETDQIKLEGAQYLFHQQRIRGSAEHITRSPDTGIRIDNATYTACEPGDDAWILIADNLDINERTGVATARNVSMETSGIPFFYAPYFQFIIDDRRATGLLYPDIGYSNDEGLQYDQPIYFNLAENRDLTLTPRLTSKRGSGLEAEYRFLTDSSYNLIGGVFFPDDDINPNHPDNRWAAVIDHRGHFGKFNSRINLEAVSDDDFLNDWGTEIFPRDRRDVFLKQDVRISTQLKNWELSASTTAYQNLIDDDQKEYQELPRLNANGHYELNGFAFNFLNEWVSFDRSDDNLIQPDLSLSLLDSDFTAVTGKRFNAHWSVTANKSNSWGYIKPKIGMNYLAYNLDSRLLISDEDNPDIFAPEISVDTGLLYERQMSLFGKAARQTLEPRLHYLYRNAGNQSELPLFDTAYATQSLEQLFRDTEFIGGDRLEDANRITLGVWSRFFANESQQRMLTLGIGQSFYLSDKTTQLTYPVDFAQENLLINGTSEKTTQGYQNGVLITDNFLDFLSGLANSNSARIDDFSENRSNTIIEADWQLSDTWAAKGNLFWGDSDNEVQQSHLSLGYQHPESDDFLKLSYSQQKNYPRLYQDISTLNFLIVDEDIEQVTLSGQWSLNEQWRFAFLVQEDFENDRNLESILGLTYESCCWNISVSWQDVLARSVNDGFAVTNPRSDKSIVFSFEFLGLGGVGTSGSRLVSER